jgi:precorrin-2/cobalt-factor-2 C20-methyltransferase
MGLNTCGKLFGVGVGPGDPELLTLKAKRVLESVDCIAVPRTAEDRDSTALTIVSAVLVLDKPVLDLVFPMTFDKTALGEGWKTALSELLKTLRQGLDVAFVTLGDPTIYSTYMYLHRTIVEAGIEAEIVPGVTSFCASAARAGISLAENRETLAVVPSAYECAHLDSILDSFDNVVLMKVARHLETVRETLRRHDLEENTVLVSLCGQKGELVETRLEAVREKKLSYFTTLIVKKGRTL